MSLLFARLRETLVPCDGPHRKEIRRGALGVWWSCRYAAHPARLSAETDLANIQQEVVTEFVDEKKLLSSPPSELHHFTSLEAACRIIAKDDIRLSHAEYSNDQTEMEEAKELIKRELSSRSPTDFFFAQISSKYEQLSPELDAYIFCTST